MSASMVSLSQSSPPWRRRLVHCTGFVFVIIVLMPWTTGSFAPPPFLPRRCQRTTSRNSRLFWTSAITHESDSTKAVQELMKQTEVPSLKKDQHGLVMLFCNQRHAKHFPDLVQQAWKQVSKKHLKVQLVCLVGGGVVGGGTEVDSIDSSPSMTMLSGILPPSARVTGYTISDDANEETKLPTSTKSDDEHQHAASHLLLVDPWAPTSQILKVLGDHPVVVGGISIPASTADSSIAWNGKCLPPGSALGLQFSGSMGIQAICAQGCRPVGKPFVVTSATNNVIIELDGVSALEQLEKVVAEASDKDKALIQSGGLLCGIASEGEEDFLARQVIGFQPKIASGGSGGAIVIATPVEEGSLFMFHVRDAEAAKHDINVMVQRYQTERVFCGPQQAGLPLAALQISCVARGQALFGDKNIDLHEVSSLLKHSDGDEAEEEKQLPIAGFFANGEIGPVGLAGIQSSSSSTGGGGGAHVHGFTTVVAVLCDYSNASSSAGEGSEDSSFTKDTSSSSMDDAAEAWG